MTKFERFWCSRREWVNLDEKTGMTLRKDAPPEAQESYRIYKLQVREYHKRMKELEKKGII